MAWTLKKTVTKEGTTGRPKLWVWKQVVKQYFNDDYLTTNASIITVHTYLGRPKGTSAQGFGGDCTVDTVLWYITNANQSSDPIKKSQDKNFVYKPGEIPAGSWKEVQYSEFTVPHKNDGQQVITVATGLVSSDFSPYSANASESIGLVTIPRETDAPAFASAEIEKSSTITLSPKIKGAKHSIKLVFGDLTNWLKADGSLGTSEVKLEGTSLPITIPKSYYTQFSGTSKNGTLYLYTYNGNTKVGSGKSKSFKITCNQGLCTPNITATVKDVNSKTIALTGDDTVVVANASNVLVTPAIRASDADDTKGYVTSKKVNGKAFTTSTYTTSKASTKDFEISVVNSRGFSNVITKSMRRLVPYVPLTFSIDKLYRPEPTTGEIRLEYSGKYYSGEFTNGLGKDTKYLELGDELIYSNITFSFPDDLYLSMQNLEINKKYVIAKTATYELFYGMFDNSIGDDVSPYIEYSVWYVEKNGTNQMSPYYLLVRKDTGVLVTGSFINDSSIINGANLGVITEVNTQDTIVYPYITEIGINNGTFNSLEITWEYKPKNSDTYVTGGVLTPKINNSKNTYTGSLSLGNNYDYKQQYDFRFKYRDKLVSGTTVRTVTRGLPIFWWSEDAVHIIGDLYVEGEINPS